MRQSQNITRAKRSHLASRTKQRTAKRSRKNTVPSYRQNTRHNNGSPEPLRHKPEGDEEAKPQTPPQTTDTAHQPESRENGTQWASEVAHTLAHIPQGTPYTEGRTNKLKGGHCTATQHKHKVVQAQASLESSRGGINVPAVNCTFGPSHAQHTHTHTHSMCCVWIRPYTLQGTGHTQPCTAGKAGALTNCHFSRGFHCMPASLARV